MHRVHFFLGSLLFVRCVETSSDGHTQNKSLECLRCCLHWRGIKYFYPITSAAGRKKSFESCVYASLYNYFVSNNRSSQNQEGFQAFKSNEHALLSFSRDIIDGFDNGKNQSFSFYLP